jgi:ankyrin repeat protein
MSLSYILSWGANINLQDIKGLTPLHLAVKTSEDVMSTRTIRALLLKGADPNIRDYSGLTPIDYLEGF